MVSVRLREPETMNLLGLLMRGLLEHALEDPARAARAAALSGDVWVRAGTMWTTLRFDDEGIEIVRGKTERRRASVGGEMDAMLGVVTGGGVVGPVLTGRVGIGGNPLFLLRMLPVIRALGDGGPRERQAGGDLR